jgi:TRAP-type mannitol/chloroaromatic compound transport system permease small subunit
VPEPPGGRCDWPGTNAKLPDKYPKTPARRLTCRHRPSILRPDFCGRRAALLRDKQVDTAHRILHRLDRFSLAFGHGVAWLALALVLLTSLIVLLRYAFGIGSIALQEGQLYTHASLFMLGIGYTLRCDEHVRVDIFYRRFSHNGRAWIDLLGTLLFLLPLCILILLTCFDYVVVSWQRQEGSADAGGLPFVYVLKTLLLLMPALLTIQALAEALRAVLKLRYPQEPDADKPAAEGSAWN